MTVQSMECGRLYVCSRLCSGRRRASITHGVYRSARGRYSQAQESEHQTGTTPQGSPDWDAFSQMTWEQVEDGARANRPGFKVVRKPLTAKRFDK
jgi:hypothetical protein